MLASRIDPGSAASFARRLLAFGDAAGERLKRRRFSLPMLDLGLATDSDDVLGMAERALVDDAAFAASPRQRLDVTILDRENHPGLPRFAWTTDMFVQAELTDMLAAAGINGLYATDNQLWRLFDAANGRGVEALAAPGQMAPWDRSFPLRDFLHWALQAQGARLIHSGTLGLGGKGVLLVGPGGSGKSGTTLAGIMAGLASAGDDYVAVSLCDGLARAQPLIRLMKQDAAGLRRAGLDPSATPLLGEPNWQGKYEFDYAALGRGPRARSLDICAIVLPRIAGGKRSSLEPAPSRLAMLALAPNNLQQLPGGWRAGLAFTADLVRSAPAYHLNLSSDAAEIAATLGEFIGSR